MELDPAALAGLIVGGGNIALLAGIFVRLGRALAVLEHHGDRLHGLEERERARERAKVLK